MIESLHRPAEGEGGGKKRRKAFKDAPSSSSSENRVVVTDQQMDDGGGGNCSSSRRNRSPEARVLLSRGHARGEEDSLGLAFSSYGFVSVIGRSRVKEDSVAVAPEIEGGEYSFFSICGSDGGPWFSDACCDRLRHVLEEEMGGRSIIEGLTGDGGRGEKDWGKLMAACLGGDSAGAGGETAAYWESVGCTALVVVVGKKEIVVANLGGHSRVVLCRGGVAMPLSHEPKGMPATSRPTEHCHMKPHLVSEPEVVVMDRTDSDDFLIIGSGGLWEVVSDKLALEVATTCLDGHIRTEGTSASKAATMLARLGMAKGSKGNISVIVVELKSRATNS